MKNDKIEQGKKIKQNNDQLFAALQQHPENSPEHQKIVARILTDNKPLVKYIARKYFSVLKATSLRMDDLIAEGNFGLLKAIKLFAPNKGTFDHYASRYIDGHILNALRKEYKQPIISLQDKHDVNGSTRTLGDTLTMPVDFEADYADRDEVNYRLNWIKEKINQLPRSQKRVLSTMVAKYTADHAQDISDSALANELRCSNQYVNKVKQKFIDNAKAMLAGVPQPAPAAQAEEPAIALTDQEKIALKKTLKGLIATKLPPQQKKAILCKFYSDSIKTNQQVAQELNLAPNTIGTYNKKSFEKLCDLCDSVRNPKQLKSILEFQTTANTKEL